MVNNEARHALYLTYLNRDADFVTRLGADLRNAGFDLWTHRHDTQQTDEDIAAWEYAQQHCALQLAVLSAGQSTNADKYPALPGDDVDVLYLLLNAAPQTEADEAPAPSVDFTGWRNTFVYDSAYAKLLEALQTTHPTLSQSEPDAETGYINMQMARIKAYKFLMQRLALQTPADQEESETRQTIFTQSMWGLHGVFQVNDAQYNKAITYRFQDLAENYTQLVIVGPPGSGKTTTLYRALLDMLRAYQARRAEFALPYLVNLGAWPKKSTFEDFITKNWTLDFNLHQMLSEGMVLLMLDGLDEIGSPSDARITEMMDWLTSCNAENVIITADADFGPAYALGVPVARMLPMSLSQIRQHVTNWLSADKADALMSHITQVAPTSDDAVPVPTATRPFTLGIMTGLAEYEEAHTIPLEEGGLLERLADLLWDGDLIPGKTLGALSRLALSMLDHNTASFTHYNAAANLLDEVTLQDSLDAHILVMHDERIGFAHPLLRDYFAVQQMLQEGLYSRLARPNIDEDGAYRPSRYERAIRYSSGFIDDVRHLVETIADVNPILAVQVSTEHHTASSKIKEYALQRALRYVNALPIHQQDMVLSEVKQLADQETVAALFETSHIHVEAESQDKETAMALKKLGSGIVKFLTDVLRGDKWQRRRGAAWALGNIQEESAVPDLIEALRDENESVRREADYALANIGKAALPYLVKALDDNDVDLRAAVIKVLGRIKDHRAVPHLKQCLQDTAWPQTADVRICDLAAIALEHIGTEEARDTVDSWRSSQNEGRKSGWHARVLSSQRLPGDGDVSLDAVLKDVESNDWSKRRNGVRQLREFELETSLPHLTQALDDAESQVRWAAVSTLASYEQPEAIPPLAKALRDSDCKIVDEAAEALTAIGEPAVEALTRALSDPDANVRGAAAEALGKTGSETAIPHLADTLVDTARPTWEQLRVCDIAAQALEQIGTEEALFTVEQWRKEQQLDSLPEKDTTSPPLLHLDDLEEKTHPHRTTIIRFLDALHEGSWHERQQAARALREYASSIKGQHEAQAVDKLTNALDDQTPLVRWSATEALAWLGDTNATPALLQALRDESWTVRIAAVRALGTIESNEALPELQGMLHDPQTLVREAAAESLGILGDERAVQSLRQVLLEEPDDFVRRTAARALGRIESTSGVSALAVALEDSSLTVRWAAAEALGEIASDDVVPYLEILLDETTRPEWDEEGRRVCDLAAEMLEQIGTAAAEAAVTKWRERH